MSTITLIIFEFKKLISISLQLFSIYQHDAGARVRAQWYRDSDYDAAVKNRKISKAGEGCKGKYEEGTVLLLLKATDDVRRGFS